MGKLFSVNGSMDFELQVECDDESEVEALLKEHLELRSVGLKGKPQFIDVISSDLQDDIDITLDQDEDYDGTCPTCYGSGGGPEPHLVCPTCKGRGSV